MQTIRHLREARKRVSTCKGAPPRRVPPGPQVHLLAVMQFAGKAERPHQLALRHPPRVIARCRPHRARIVERRAHRAEGVAEEPRAVERLT